MTKPRLRKEILEEYISYLENPDLIGVAFFLKDGDHVLALGDVADTGIAAQGDNLWEAIESYDMIARMQDVTIAEKFGEAVVRMSLTDEELVAKTAAVSSLKALLEGRPGIVDVRDTPTSIAVFINSEGAFDGPWEWEGYPVHAEGCM